MRNLLPLPSASGSSFDRVVSPASTLDLRRQRGVAGSDCARLALGRDTDGNRSPPAQARHRPRWGALVALRARRDRHPQENASRRDRPPPVRTRLPVGGRLAMRPAIISKTLQGLRNGAGCRRPARPPPRLRAAGIGGGRPLRVMRKRLDHASVVTTGNLSSTSGPRSTKRRVGCSDHSRQAPG